VRPLHPEPLDERRKVVTQVRHRVRIVGVDRVSRVTLVVGDRTDALTQVGEQWQEHPPVAFATVHEDERLAAP
jgi:hypothetical protein